MSFSGDRAVESLRSVMRLRCAALTAFWSCAMSLSLKSGGAASPGIGRSFLGSQPFSRFNMSSVLQRFWRENASEWRPAQDSGSLFSKMLVCIRRNGDDYVAWGVERAPVSVHTQWPGEFL